MKFVLDTNVVSALRVRGRHRTVEAWAAGVAIGDLFTKHFTPLGVACLDPWTQE